MKRKRHREEQIIAVLKEAQAGGAVDEVCRCHGISQATCYKWRRQFGGMEVSGAKRLRFLEEEPSGAR
jgi:putative transposase